MRTPPCILIADDQAMNLEILQDRLAAHGYTVLTATDGEEALTIARTQQPDLILLDVMMPKMDGVEVCRCLKADASLPFMPIIMITARSEVEDIVAGLEAGAEEYLTKPVDQTALVARVKSMLRIKELHDTVQVQARQLEAWGQTLEQRVAEQLDELERIGRLKRFFSPQLAELLVSAGGERLLASHRQEITVVFCDLRGFTAFSEVAEPEEVMGILGEYHTALGALISRFEATLEHYAGDGVMVFFNDPLPCPDPIARAVQMAVAMRQQMDELLGKWQQYGHQLGFGVGIAHGYATLGQIGFEGRLAYGAIGSVANLAARLCDGAGNGQILVSRRVQAAVAELAAWESLGDLSFKGFSRPIPVFNVLRLTATSATMS